MRLAGRTAIVTGAASGIGAAIARAFVGQGACVALVDRDADGLAAIGAELGEQTLSLQSDVAVNAAARDGVAAVLARWGRVDILVTAAGISTGGTVDQITEAEWDRVFAVNVRGTYLWAHHTLPAMIAAGQGNLVLLGSQLAVSSAGNNAAYIASKGAIVSLGRTMAVDHAQQGIRVNVIMPGVIDTPMPRRSLARYPDPAATRERWAKRHAMGRFGRPDEVAKAALFLASDESSFTTGSQLFVDGGWTAM
ncbi:MAG: SDR family oxidoreductase [Ramlibacter sp.]